MKALAFRAAFFAAFLSTALPVGASSAETGKEGDARTWSVSGAELTEALEGKSGSGARESEAERSISAARASAYIAGVADTTSGACWCAAGSVLPHELTDRVYTYLRSVSTERLKGRASVLVIEGLARNFPCRAGK